MAISFVGLGAAPAQVASGNQTAPYPTGLAANDILFLYANAKDNVVITLPAGWTKEYEANDGTGQRLTIAWKRRSAIDAETSVLLTHSGGGGLMSRVAAYRGVVTTGDPFEATTSQNNRAVSGSGTWGGMPLTTVSANTWRLHVLGQSGNSTAVSSSTPATETDVTQRDWQHSSSPANTLIFYDAIQPLAGAADGNAITWTASSKLVSMEWEGALTPSAVVAAPATPTGLEAKRASAQVTLDWIASASADAYRVYRNGTQVYDGAALSFTDTGLANGTTYSYTVSAYNSGGESSQSAALAVTPRAATAFDAVLDGLGSGAGPWVHHKLDEPVGSTVTVSRGDMADDGDVLGGVTFGTPGFLPGDGSATCATFDGSTGNIALEQPDEVVNQTAFTTGIWVVPNASMASGVKGVPFTKVGDSPTFANDQYGIDVSSTPEVANMWGAYIRDSAGYNLIHGGQAVEGVPTLLVMSWDGSTLSFWANKVLLGAVPSGPPIANRNLTSTMRIGSDGGADIWDGKLANFFFLPFAIGQTDVEAIYDAGGLVTSTGVAGADSMGIADVAAVAVAAAKADTATQGQSQAVAANATGTDTATQAQSGSTTTQTSAAGSDSATETDAASMLASANQAGSDAAAQGQSATALASPAASDSAALGQTQAASASAAGADASTLSGSSAIGSQLSLFGTDAFSETDVASADKHNDLSVADSGSQADSQAVSAAAAAADTALEGSSGSLATASSGSDSASETSVSQLSFSALRSDSSTMTDAAAFAVAAVDADSASASEAFDLAVSAQVTDAYSMASASTLSATLAVLDSLTEFESAIGGQTTAIGGSDSSAQSGTGSTSQEQILVGGDALSVSEALSLVGLFALIDSSAETEVATAGFTDYLSVTDDFSMEELGGLAVAILDGDAGLLSDFGIDSAQDALAAFDTFVEAAVAQVVTALPLNEITNPTRAVILAWAARATLAKFAADVGVDPHSADAAVAGSIKRTTIDRNKESVSVTPTTTKVNIGG